MNKSASQKKPALWILALLLIIPLAEAVWFGFYSVAPFPIDQIWHDQVVANEGTLGYYVSLALHIVGSTKGMAVVSVLILAVTLVMRRWSHGLTIAVTMLSVLIASKVIKFIVDRPRPVDMIVQETETSFPSGHSLGAGAIATVLVCFVYANHKIATTGRVIAIILGTAYTLGMMWSRTALHVHWLSDTVGGALLGVVLALLFSRIFLFRETSLTTTRGKHAL